MSGRGSTITVASIDLVMPGLEPGIHVFLSRDKEVVDGRDKPGHDENLSRNARAHVALLPASNGDQR